MRPVLVLRSTTTGRAPSICPDFLKEKLYRYLADTRVARSRHLAKIAGNEIADRVQKLRVIEHVENSPRNSNEVFSVICVLFCTPISVLSIPGPWKNRRLAFPGTPKQPADA